MSTCGWASGFDSSGRVEIAIEPNTNPEALGCPPFARDFPVCTATVTYAGEGYKAALGWLQLVRSTDGASAGREFELDPFEPLGRSPHPFCFFGFAPVLFAPVLFDAPARRTRQENGLDRRDISVLCPDGSAQARDACDPRIQLGLRGPEEGGFLTPPAPIAPVEWDKHRAFLGREHPEWAFATGYRSH